ncbi:leucine-rich repeat domain-containing protein [Jiulongibacter sp. NS-SX5]|uniref:leucine-rich repeat domain-containing protein n=1 Tax=Jiulongibacter sp. NS-SX5 TaxID=3463854 RepID=UPI0040598D35
MKKSILLIACLFSFYSIQAQFSFMSFEEYNLQNGEKAAERLASSQSIRIEEEGTVAKMKTFVFNHKIQKTLGRHSFLENFSERVSLWLLVQLNDNFKPDLILYRAQKMNLGEGRIDYEPITFTEKEVKKLQNILIPTVNSFNYEQIHPEDKILSLHFNNFRYTSKTPEAAVAYLIGLADTTTKIDLSDYQLKAVPKEIFQFSELQSLNLSNNYLTEVPKKLWRLKKLKSVNLSKNELTNNSLRLKRNKSIKTLNFQYNYFTQLPKRVHKLKTVEDLFAGNNFLTDFEFQKIKKRASIKNLNLYNSAISKLPRQLIRLSNLEELDLYYNNLRSIGVDLSKFQNLRIVALSFNGMWKLPDEIGDLKGLEKLYAHHNKIKSIPSLSESVIHLDLGYNLFEELPTSVLKLKNLREIDFSNCRLYEMPKELSQLSQLNTVFIGGNPFENESTEMQKFEEFKLAMEKRSAMVK